MKSLTQRTDGAFNWNALVLATAAVCGGAGAQDMSPTPEQITRMRLDQGGIKPTPLTPETTSRSPAMTLPSTPQELWSRILTLLKKNGGFTTHQEVEEILGLKFTAVEKEGEKRVLGAAFFYSMKEEIQGLGLVKMSLFEDPKKTSLGLSWGPDIYERPNCLSLSQVVNDIDALGWSPAQFRPNKPGRNLWNFYTREAMAESAKTGKPLRTYVDTSSLTLAMPNQFSQCVNGFSVRIWRP